MGLIAQVAKGLLNHNINSSTGRNPHIAAPAASPKNADSEIGVSRYATISFDLRFTKYSASSLTQVYCMG